MKVEFDSELADADILYQANVTERAPRVSVRMITYGHERFIIKAVSTILEQTYRDFELIISDDASPDNTKQVLLGYLNGYHGDAQVIYVRHRKNSRSGGKGHAAVFDQLVRGDLMMSMDGDDFSMPTRLQRTVELWDSLDPVPSIMIVNAYRYLDAEKKMDGLAYDGLGANSETRKYYPPGDPLVYVPAFGSGTVYSRRFMDWCKQFKPAKEPIIAGDVVTVHRALLDQGVWYVNEPLLYYRVNAGSVSFAGASGKDWIHDRLVRFKLLKEDMIQVAPENRLTRNQEHDIDHLIKRTEFSESLIDCSMWVWPWRWLRFLFYSPKGARGALQCRIKLILFGNVNAAFSWRKCFKLGPSNG